MIIILMGVAGSGKTRVGQALSKLTGWLFLDADNYHSQASIDKMSRHEPLSDADRAPWLNTLSSIIETQLKQDENTILACSALKHAYRTQLSQPNPQDVYFVYLKVSLELLKLRLTQRQGHFMQPTMLLSQLETLEEPKADEALIVDVQAHATPEMLASYIQTKLDIFPQAKNLP